VVKGQAGLLRDPYGRGRLPVAPSGQSGFSLLFVLFALVLVGLSMMGANKQWTTMMKREREAELLFRGHQYRRAIANYVDGATATAPRQYPRSVDELLKDERPPKLRRHLRSAYMDPITGGPFHAVPCKDRIKGVYSPSDVLTLKHDNFPPEYEQFRATALYREWVFQYEPGAPGSSPPPPTPTPPGQKAPAAAPPVRAPIPC
jgi:type II secretory pathway pseudopilin PulG